MANADIEDGYLLATEWPIYDFDAVPMVLVPGICCWWYVGDITKLPAPQEMDRFEGQTEYERVYPGRA
jgi:hypothetical protein